MELVIGFLILAIASIQIFLFRHFFSQLSKKISHLSYEARQTIQPEKYTVDPIVKREEKVVSEPNDFPKDNPDEIEFSEWNPLSLPDDVKFEIEGGDTSIPPEYNSNAN